MNRFPLDDSSADRLLAGGLSPEDAPPGYARLSELVQAAQGPAGPEELGRPAQLAAIADAVRSNPSPSNAPGRTSMLTKLLSVKVAAIAAAAVLFGATAAAAGTGTLPDNAQTKVSDALSH